MELVKCGDAVSSCWCTSQRGRFSRLHVTMSCGSWTLTSRSVALLFLVQSSKTARNCDSPHNAHGRIIALRSCLLYRCRSRMAIQTLTEVW